MAGLYIKPTIRLLSVPPASPTYTWAHGGFRMVTHPVLAAGERSHSGPPLVTISDKQVSTEAQMVNPPVTQSLAIPTYSRWQYKARPTGSVTPKAI